MKRILFFGVALLALVSCARSDFSKPASLDQIEQAMGDKGLTVCAQWEVEWNAAPGFDSGNVYDVELDCSTYDPNKPGARVTVAQFTGVEAREAALRNFETVYRRHIGAGITYSNGPLVILVDGNQKDEVIEVFQQAMASTGAEP